MEERFWEVTKDGVQPIMCVYDDLKKDYEWMMCHCYHGKLIFENYSRAMLCWYERYGN